MARTNLTLEKALTLYLAYAIDLSPRTARNLRERVRLWRRLGGPDDCRSITADSFQEFRRAALAVALKPHTIETAVNAIKTLLRHLGPQGDGVPHGLGMLKSVPFTGRRLKTASEPRPPATFEQLDEIYRHARCMTYPRVRDIRAADWWRAFLVLAYNTGLRVSDLVYKLSWDHVRWEQRVIELRAGKTGLYHRIPINDTLARHLETIRRDTGPVLGLQAKQTTHLLKHLREACESCGVPYFTPHAVRRLAGTEFEKTHPGTGALLLGHSLHRGMTFGHYVAAEAILRPAADKLPQPEAFTSTKER